MEAQDDLEEFDGGQLHSMEAYNERVLLCIQNICLLYCIVV